MKNYFLKTIALISFLIVITSCDKDDEIETLAPSVTSVTTSENVEVTYTTIKISGNVSSDGGSEITARGVCWSTNPSPTIADDMTTETSNTFTSTISNLVTNTAYYFRVYATNSIGTSYSESQPFNTLSFSNSSWKITTIYPNQSNFEIYSKADFFNDGTTKFDEMDLPGQCPGCFITYGTWELNGNDLTYIWEGSDSSSSTYIYTGTLSGMEIQGVYSHISEPNGTWSAILL